MNTNSPLCYFWAAQLGVAITKKGPAGDDPRLIEHADGSIGLITVDAVSWAAMMVLEGKKDRHVRQFLLDNTIFKGALTYGG